MTCPVPEITVGTSGRCPEIVRMYSDAERTLLQSKRMEGA